MSSSLSRSRIDAAKNGLEKRLNESVQFIKKDTRIQPRVAVILGSGLSSVAEMLTKARTIEYSEIPHYPRSTVEGHSGKMVIGNLGVVPVLFFQGRIHLYERDDLDAVLYPIRVASSLGIKSLIITNAAGAVNVAFKPGDLMIITDQINLTFEHPPLQRPTRKILSPDLYESRILKILLDAGRECGTQIQQGIYCGLKGPSYETAAEIEMVRKLGADAVGMSTVNEVILATMLGMKVGGISCITNLSTGISSVALTHQEVQEVATRIKKPLGDLLVEAILRVHA